MNKSAVIKHSQGGEGAVNKKVERYSDIIDLPHHQSARRPHMSVYNRSAQFAPFAALSGYGTLISDTTELLLLDKRITLDEDQKSILDLKMQTLLKNLPQDIKVNYFDESANGLGGSYVEYEGQLQILKEHPSRMTFKDGKEIPVADIVNILF